MCPIPAPSPYQAGSSELLDVLAAPHLRMAQPNTHSEPGLLWQGPRPFLGEQGLPGLLGRFIDAG